MLDGADVAVLALRGHHRLNRLEGVLHRVGSRRRVLGDHPEGGEQRRLVAGDQAQLARGVLQVGVAHDGGRLQEGAPLGDEVRRVTVAELPLRLDAVDARGALVSQHPLLAGKEPVGVREGLLHEFPSALAERTRNLLGVDDGLRRAWELLVEIHAGVLPGRFGQHELIDPLDAGELRQVAAAAVHRQRIVLGGERIRGFQFLAVEVELLADQLQAVGIHVPSHQPVPHEDRRQEQLGTLVVVRSGDQIGLERVIDGAVLIGGSRRRGKPGQRLNQSRLRAAEQQLVETAEVRPAQRGVKLVSRVESPAQPQGRAFPFVEGQRLERLPQRVQARERVNRGRLKGGRLHGADPPHRAQAHCSREHGCRSTKR